MAMTREEILEKHPKATETQITATLAHYNGQAVDMETSFADMAKGIGRSGLQGLTFGAGDELTALARSLFGAGSYDELVQEERDALEDFRKDHPGWAYGTELVSGMVVPGGILKGGLTAAKALKAGGLSGGLYGAGASEGDVTTLEGLKERGTGAAVGAAVGAPLGVGGQKLGEVGARYLRRRLANRPGRNYRGATEDEMATATLQKEFRDELETTNPALLKELNAQGTPPSEAFRDQVSGRMTIADLAAMESARSGVSQGFGSARRLAAKRLEGRAETEFSELTGELEDVLRATGRADDMAINVKKITGRRDQPLYKAAGGQDIQTDTWLEDIFFDPLVKKAYNDRRNVVKTFVRTKKKGYTDDDLMPVWDDLIEVAEDGTQSFKVDNIATRHLHQLKQGLDQRAGWAAKNASSKQDQYKALASKLNSEVGQLNPQYAAANRVNHLGRQVEKAVARGAKAFNNTSDTAVRREFNALSSALEKKAFRSGMLQELYNRVGEGSMGKFLARNSSSRIRNALKATFPDQASYNKFVARAKQEAEFRNVEADVGVGGSRTARTQKDIEKFESGGVIDDIGEAVVQGVAVSAPWAAQGFVKKYSRALRGLKDERVARAAADILFTDTPEAAQQAFDKLLKGGQRIKSEDLKTLRVLKGMLSGVSAPIAGQAGSAAGESIYEGLLAPR